MLKWYTLCDIEDKEQYAKFIEYMLKSSDCFSVIYFRHNEGERLRKSAKQIRDELRPFKIYSKNTNEWPGTITWDKKHIYRIAYYYSDMKCLDTLVRVGGLFNWDYPAAPMDLCFYKDNYCCLKSTAHEEMSSLYIDTEEAPVLESRGIKIVEGRPEYVFYCGTLEDLEQMGIPETSLKPEYYDPEDYEPEYCDIKKYVEKYEKRKSQ